MAFPRFTWRGPPPRTVHGLVVRSVDGCHVARASCRHDRLCGRAVGLAVDGCARLPARALRVSMKACDRSGSQGGDAPEFGDASVFDAVHLDDFGKALAA